MGLGTQMEDDYTTDSHKLTYIFLSKWLGECPLLFELGSERNNKGHYLTIYYHYYLPAFSVLSSLPPFTPLTPSMSMLFVRQISMLRSTWISPSFIQDLSCWNRWSSTGDPAGQTRPTKNRTVASTSTWSSIVHPWTGWIAVPTYSRLCRRVRTPLRTASRSCRP